MKPSEKQTTRARVAHAAWSLIEQGISPSRAKIREQIGTGGSDATVADALHQFWAELGQFVKESRIAPEIPAEFLAAFNEMVKQARALEAQRWKEERETLRQQATEANFKREQLLQDHQALSEKLVVSQDQLKQIEAQLASAQKTVEKQHSEGEACHRQVAELERQLAETMKRENAVRKEKEKELNLAYHRASETEERLTRLYDEERTARERADKALEARTAQIRDLESARARLEEQSQFSKKQIDNLETQLLEIDALKKQVWKTERALDVANAQLALYKDREVALSEQLEKARKETTAIEMDLLVAQSNIKAHAATIASQRETILDYERRVAKRKKKDMP